MKKLMIAAAMVCAAAFAQAATYKWSFDTSTNPIYDGFNATAVGKQSANALGAGINAYLIYTTGLSQGDLLTALRSGKDIATAAGANLLASTTTKADGTLNLVNFTTDPEVIPLDGSGKIAGYLVVVDGDYVGFGPSLSKAADTEGGTTAFSYTTAALKNLKDKDGTTAYSTPGWYSTVPEPTSGLLLLLGVAGLALRRRRA